ncbi:hypothetical protein [Pseudomonas viridiflava]|uniref:hypothetical protein n=1 Tax=Pseudomonas viridiflava TaxID=33069 RepID=UPI0013CEA2DC|nr:hypothetical protein [Pseudomonas viridiflava]
MDKSDFDYDSEEFFRDISKTIKYYNYAKESFLSDVKHWKELSGEYIKGNFSAEVEGNLVRGKIIDRDFVLTISPLVLNSETYALVILFMPHPMGGDPTELSRFLVSRDGNVNSDDGSLLLSAGDVYKSFKLFVVVLRKVIHHNHRK